MSLQTDDVSVHVDLRTRVVNVHHSSSYTVIVTETPGPLKGEITPGLYASTVYTEVANVVSDDVCSSDGESSDDDIDGKQGTGLCVGVDRRGTNIYWWFDTFGGRPALTDELAGPDHEWTPTDCPSNTHTKVRTKGSGAPVRSLSPGDAAAIAITAHQLKGQTNGESIFVNDAPGGHARRFAGKYRRANSAAKKMVTAKAKELYAPGWWKLGAKAVGERAKAVTDLFNIIA